MAIEPYLPSFSSRYFASVLYPALSTMGGVGIDLELWRARVGMYHAARSRRQKRGKTPKRKIPLMGTCFQALAVVMMVSLAPAVVNMLLIMAGDVEPNPGPGQSFITHVPLSVSMVQSRS